MESYANILLDDLSHFLLVFVNPFHTNFKHIPLAVKDLNIPLNVCKCSTEKIYSTRDIGTQTVRKCYSKSSPLIPDYKNKSFLSPSGIEPATDVLCHNISVVLSWISASEAVTAVLACTQMILQFNGETKSQL